jgi:osmoprotectant transport system permease protein
MTWIAQNRSLIVERSLQHISLAVPAIVMSMVLAIPIGWLATRLQRGRSFLLSGIGMLYAVPSLPLFIALPALLGTDLRDPVNVVVALTLYGLAVLVPVVADALRAVDSTVVQAASAIGFDPWSRFWRVELPLAGPVMLASSRVVAVSSVSLATVGAVLGVKSLGLLFTDGVQRNIPEEIAAGILATVAIALFMDVVLVLVGRALMPWWRRSSGDETARTVVSTRVRAR